MPSSFRGSHGKIVYKLTVTLSRSWKLDRTAEQELNFVSRSIPDLQNFMVSWRFEQFHGAIPDLLCDVTVCTRHHHKCRMTQLGIIYLLWVSCEWKPLTTILSLCQPLNIATSVPYFQIIIHTFLQHFYNKYAGAIYILCYFTLTDHGVNITSSCKRALCQSGTTENWFKH